MKTLDQHDPYQQAMLRQFWGFGGCHMGFYACLYHHLGLIAEQEYNLDLEAVINLEKGSLEAKKNILAFLFIERHDN